MASMSASSACTASRSISSSSVSMRRTPPRHVGAAPCHDPRSDTPAAANQFAASPARQASAQYRHRNRGRRQRQRQRGDGEHQPVGQEHPPEHAARPAPQPVESRGPSPIPRGGDDRSRPCRHRTGPPTIPHTAVNVRRCRRPVIWGGALVSAPTDGRCRHQRASQRRHHRHRAPAFGLRAQHPPRTPHPNPWGLTPISWGSLRHLAAERWIKRPRPGHQRSSGARSPSGSKHITQDVHGAVDYGEIGGLCDLTLRACDDQAGLILDHGQPNRVVVGRYLHPLRSAQPATPQPPTPPTVRDATGWLTRHPDSLTDDERDARHMILDRSPAMRAARDHVSEFAQILTQRRGHTLHDWIAGVGTDGAPALRSFATGLERDLDAVTAGLTLPYSSGPVEGMVNRIILWNLTVKGPSGCRPGGPRRSAGVGRAAVVPVVVGSVRREWGCQRGGPGVGPGRPGRRRRRRVRRRSTGWR